MERLSFPYLAYTNPPQSLFPGKIKTAFIYTMNAPKERIKDAGGQQIDMNEFILKTVFNGSSESLLSTETYQFDDYSKILSSLFNVEERTLRRKEVFPLDCEKAFELGSRLAKGDR